MSDKQRGVNQRVAASTTLSKLLPSARFDNSQSGKFSQVGQSQSANPQTTLHGVQKHVSSTHSVPQKVESSMPRHSNIQSELELAFQKRLRQPKKKFPKETPNSSSSSVSKSPAPQVQNIKSDSSSASIQSPCPPQPQPQPAVHSHYSASSSSPQTHYAKSISSTDSASIQPPARPQHPKYSNYPVSSPSPHVQNVKSVSNTVSTSIQSQSQHPKYSNYPQSQSPQVQNTNIQPQSQPQQPKYSKYPVPSPSAQVPIQNPRSAFSAVSPSVQPPLQPQPPPQPQTQKPRHFSVTSPPPQPPNAAAAARILSPGPLQPQPPKYNQTNASPPPPPRSSSLQKTQQRSTTNVQVQSSGIAGYRKVNLRAGMVSPRSFNQDYSDFTDSEDCRTPDPSIFGMSEAGRRTPLESEDEAETASKHSHAASSTMFPFKSEIVKQFEKPVPVFLKCQNWCNQIPDSQVQHEINDPNLRKELSNIESFESAMLDYFQTLNKTDDDDLRSETSVSSMGSFKSEYKLRSLINNRFQNSEQIETVLTDLLKISDQYVQGTDTESVVSESQKPEKPANYQTLNLEKKSLPRRGRATVIRRSSIPGEASGSESESENVRKPSSYKTVISELQAVLRQRGPIPEPPESEESGLGSSEHSNPPTSPLSPNGIPPTMPKPQFSKIHEPRLVKTAHAKVTRKPLVNAGDFKMLLGELSTAWSKRLRRIRKAQLVSQRGMQSSLYANFQGFRIPETLLDENSSSKYANFEGKREPASVLEPEEEQRPGPEATAQSFTPVLESDSDTESYSRRIYPKSHSRRLRPSEIAKQEKVSKPPTQMENPPAPTDEMTGHELLESVQQPGLRKIDFKMNKYISGVAAGGALPEISEESYLQSPSQRKLAAHLNRNVEPVPTSVPGEAMPASQPVQGQVTSQPQTSQIKSPPPTQSQSLQAAPVHSPSTAQTPHMKTTPPPPPPPQQVQPTPSLPQAQVWTPPSYGKSSLPTNIYGPVPYQKPNIKSNLPSAQEEPPMQVEAPSPAKVSSPPPPPAQVWSPPQPAQVWSPPQHAQPTQVPVPPPQPTQAPAPPPPTAPKPTKAPIPPPPPPSIPSEETEYPKAPSSNRPLGSAFVSVQSKGNIFSELCGKFEEKAEKVHAPAAPVIQNTQKTEETQTVDSDTSSIPSSKISQKGVPVAPSPTMFRCFTPTTANALLNSKTEEERQEILERLSKITEKNVTVKEEMPELPMDIVRASAIRIQPLQLDRLVRVKEETSEDLEEPIQLKTSEIVLNLTSEVSEKPENQAPSTEFDSVMETETSATEITYEISLGDTIESQNDQSTADENKSDNVISTELDSTVENVLPNVESMDKVGGNIDLDAIEACIIVDPEDVTPSVSVVLDDQEVPEKESLSVVLDDSVSTETVAPAEESTADFEFTISVGDDSVPEEVTLPEIQSSELVPEAPLLEAEPVPEDGAEILPTSSEVVIPDWSTSTDVSSEITISSPSEFVMSSTSLTEAPLVEDEADLGEVIDVEPVTYPEETLKWSTAPVSGTETLTTNSDDISAVGLLEVDAITLEEASKYTIPIDTLGEPVSVSDTATDILQLEPFISVLSPVDPETPTFEEPPEVINIPVENIEPEIIDVGPIAEISEKKDLLIELSEEQEMSYNQLKEAIKSEMLKSEDVGNMLVLESLKSFGPDGSPDDYEYEDALCYSSDESLTYEDTLTSPIMPRRVYKEVVRAEIGSRIETLQSWATPEPLKSWPNQENLPLCSEEIVADEAEEISQEESPESDDGMVIKEDVPFNSDPQQLVYTLPTIYEATEESLEEERRILREIDNVDKLIDECVETLEMSPVELAQVQEQDLILRGAEIPDFISEINFEREVQLDSQSERAVQINSVLTSLANLQNGAALPAGSGSNEAATLFGELKRSHGLTALDQICDDQSPESQVQDGSPKEKVSDHVTPDTFSDDDMLNSIPYNVAIEKPELFDEEILPAMSRNTIFDKMGVGKILGEEKLEDTEDEISPALTRSDKTSDEEEIADAWMVADDDSDLNVPKMAPIQQPLADKFENLIEFLESDAAREMREFEQIESVCEKLSKDRKDSVVSNFSVGTIEKSEDFEKLIQSLDSELEADVTQNVLVNPTEDLVSGVVMAASTEVNQQMVTSDYKSESEDHGKPARDLSSKDEFVDAHSETEFSDYMLSRDPEDSGYVDVVSVQVDENPETCVDDDYLNYLAERDMETYKQMTAKTPVMTRKQFEAQKTASSNDGKSHPTLELVVTPPEQEHSTVSEEISLMSDSGIETKEMPMIISDDIDEEYFTIKGTDRTVEKAFEYLLSSKTVPLKEDNETSPEPKTDQSLSPIENSGSTSEEPISPGEEIVSLPSGDSPERDITKLSKPSKKHGRKNKKGKKDNNISITETESKINGEISKEQEIIVSNGTTLIEKTVTESHSEVKIVSTEKTSEVVSVISSSSKVEESKTDSVEPSTLQAESSHTKKRTTSTSSTEHSSVSCERTPSVGLPSSEEPKEPAAGKKKRKKKKKKGKDKEEPTSPTTDVQEPPQVSEKPSSDQVPCNVLADIESQIIVEKSEKEPTDETQKDSKSSEEPKTVASPSVSGADKSQEKIGDLLTSDTPISMSVEDAQIAQAAVPKAFVPEVSATAVTTVQETTTISTEPAKISSSSVSSEVVVKSENQDSVTKVLEVSESVTITSDSKSKEDPVQKPAVPSASVPGPSEPASSVQDTTITLPESMGGSFSAVTSEFIEDSVTVEDFEVSTSSTSVSESVTVTVKEAPVKEAEVPPAVVPEVLATTTPQETTAISSESAGVSSTSVSSEFVVKSVKQDSVAGESVSKTVKEEPIKEAAVAPASVTEVSVTKPETSDVPTKSVETSSTEVSSEFTLESAERDAVADEFLELSSLMSSTLESLESIKVAQVEEPDSSSTDAAKTSLSSDVSSNQQDSVSAIITANIEGSGQSLETVRISENSKDVKSETLIPKPAPVVPHSESVQAPTTISPPSKPAAPHLESSKELASSTSIMQSAPVVPSPTPSAKQLYPIAPPPYSLIDPALDSPSPSSLPKQPAPVGLSPLSSIKQRFPISSSSSLSASPKQPAHVTATVTQSASAPQSPALPVFNKYGTKISTSNNSLESKQDTTSKTIGSSPLIKGRNVSELSKSYQKKAEFLSSIPGPVGDSFPERRSSLPVLNEIKPVQPPPVPQSLRDTTPPQPPVRDHPKNNISSDSLNIKIPNGAPICDPEDSNMSAATLERTRNNKTNGVDEFPTSTLERKNSPTKRFRDLKHFSRISNLTYDEVIELEEEEHRRRYDFGYNRRIREMKYFGRICRVDSDESMMSRKSGSSDSGIGHRDLRQSRMMTTSSTSLQVPGSSATVGRRPKGLSESAVAINSPQQFEPVMSYVSYNQTEDANAAEMQRYSSSAHGQSSTLDRRHQDASGYGRIQRKHDITRSTHSLDYHAGHPKFRHSGLHNQEVSGRSFQDSGICASNFSVGGQESDDDRSMVSSASFMGGMDSTDDDCESIYEDVAMYKRPDTMSLRSDVGSVKSLSKLKKFGSKLKKFSKIKLKKFWK